MFNYSLDTFTEIDKDYLPIYLVSEEDIKLAEFEVYNSEPEYEFSHCTDSDPAFNS